MKTAKEISQKICDESELHGGHHASSHLKGYSPNRGNNEENKIADETEDSAQKILLSKKK